jgi:hypothetical protein
MDQDLYTRWLGIAPGERPPDHYTLLSVPLFTHAPNAIEAAARAQMEKLDPYAMHPDREQRDSSTRMMNEIAQARMVLVDPVRSDEYDRQLAKQRGIDPPGTGDASHMEETIAGGAPVIDSALDINAFNQPESAELGFQANPQEVVTESLFQEHAPLQDIDQTFVPPRSRHTTIPFSLLILMGVMAVAVVVGGIIIVSFLVSRETPPEKSVSPPSQPKIIVTPPVPEQFMFFDAFDETPLSASYEIRAGAPPHVQIQDGKLVLGSPDESPTRVDLTPRLTRMFFRRVDIVVHIEQGASFTFGLSRLARLTIRRGPQNLRIRVTPGNLVQNGNTRDGVLMLPADESITVTLLRDEMNNASWRINNDHVATSPEMPDKSKRGYPAISLRSAGAAGHRVAINSIEVVYDPDETQ